MLLVHNNILCSISKVLQMPFFNHQQSDLCFTSPVVEAFCKLWNWFFTEIHCAVSPHEASDMWWDFGDTRKQFCFYYLFFFYLKREIVVIRRWSGCTHPTACYTETEFNLARSDDGSFWWKFGSSPLSTQNSSLLSLMMPFNQYKPDQFNKQWKQSEEKRWSQVKKSNFRWATEFKHNL